MTYILFTALALIVGAIHVLRDTEPRSAGRTAEVLLLWWLVFAVGVEPIVGGLFHLFDGPSIAEDIGYTRGNGGFQYEVGIGDVARGVAGVLCFRFRGTFWLAVIVVTAVSLYGDAYGHIHQAVEYDNHDPDNTGLPLYYGFIAPTVAIGLYVIARRFRGSDDAVGRTA